MLLHGSRSGNAGLTRAQEFTNTSGWAANPSNTLGWSITCGEDAYDRHMDEEEWGWNAYDASKGYLACEFAQAVEAWDITDAQVNAFCHWFARQARVAWPALSLSMPTHAEAEHLNLTGHGVTGKSDVFGWESPRADELRGRILARLDSQYGIR